MGSELVEGDIGVLGEGEEDFFWGGGLIFIFEVELFEVFLDEVEGDGKSVEVVEEGEGLECALDFSDVAGDVFGDEVEDLLIELESIDVRKVLGKNDFISGGEGRDFDNGAACETGF